MRIAKNFFERGQPLKYITVTSENLIYQQKNTLFDFN
jgi:hypothetical protein